MKKVISLAHSVSGIGGQSGPVGIYRQTVCTSFSGFNGSSIANQPVVKIFDTRSVSSATPSTNWQPPNNSFSWTSGNLGQVFGV